MSGAGAPLLRNAVAQHQSGKLPQAIAAYRQVLAADPSNPDALHMLGVALAQAGHPAEAVPLIQRALQRYPNNGLVHLNLANALNAMQRHAEALASYQRAAELAPENAALHGAVCRAALMVGSHDEALASSARALRLQPNDFGTLLNRATSLIEVDRLTEALDCCDRALALAPDYWGVHLRRGVTLAKLGRYAEAEVHLARGVALDPSNAAAHYDLGNLYGTQRRARARAGELYAGTRAAPGLSRSTLEHSAPQATARGVHERAGRSTNSDLPWIRGRERRAVSKVPDGPAASRCKVSAFCSGPREVSGTCCNSRATPLWCGIAARKSYWRCSRDSEHCSTANFQECAR